jgi:hypothetical protein
LLTASVPLTGASRPVILRCPVEPSKTTGLSICTWEYVTLEIKEARKRERIVFFINYFGY